MAASIRPLLSNPRRISMAMTSRRTYSTPPHSSSQHPQPQASHSPTEPRQPSRAGTFYKSFGSPILKTFLGALFTYQVIYWSWLKLESLETKKNLEDEIRGLETELVVSIREKKGGGEHEHKDKK
ncbi:uncharacterized protein BDR25DRAFT_310997 [Lindgomyces ingoldianus]|uniref:Uncharacterized protein n=1 Tax=Lindgomyces ingoldianus TaxID=673940 RepID=A0ACB6R5K0_9PLEO|nr:uncharacterized protein BDR25DRAFT_310997 [Lindgomyces ingoldianus]KAF2474519.1 hypothetical protein BDR25DRAFT_310997 [Lindgomyces ingoldianus]